MSQPGGRRARRGGWGVIRDRSAWETLRGVRVGAPTYGTLAISNRHPCLSVIGLIFKKSVKSRFLKTAWLIKQGGYKTNTGRLGERDIQYTKNWFVHHAYFLWQRQDDRLLRSVVSVSAGKHAVIRRVMPGQCCMPHCYTAHPWRLAAKSNKPEAGTQQPGRSWCFSLSRGRKKNEACVSSRTIWLLKSGTWQRRRAHLSAQPGPKAFRRSARQTVTVLNRLRGALHLLRVKSLSQMLANLFSDLALNNTFTQFIYISTSDAAYRANFAPLSYRAGWYLWNAWAHQQCDFKVESRSFMKVPQPVSPVPECLLPTWGRIKKMTDHKLYTWSWHRT